jgi:hypothetical protein
MTFSAYCDLPFPAALTGPVEIIKEQDMFRIYINDKPLMTRLNNPYSHVSPRLLQLIATGMIVPAVAQGSRITGLNLFGFTCDVVDKEPLLLQEGFNRQVETDPFALLKTTGKTGVQPLLPGHELFYFSYLTLSSMILYLNDLINQAIREHVMEDAGPDFFPELIQQTVKSLPVVKQTLVAVLGEVHNAGLVLPSAMVQGLIVPEEYANGLLALQLQPKGRYQQILAEATTAVDYLKVYAAAEERGASLQSLIGEGEHARLEFKSTLRWDIKAGKTNQAIERTSLKTISAFLNSDGGTLLIGIRDDGSVEGIETDKFVNEDKFLLHLWTLIRTCLGRDVSPSIRTRLEKMDEKTVCIVQCARHSRPVFLRQPGFNEEFYIRLGPASNAMDISEALKYIADHWRESAN